ncbi:MULTISPECIES: hypothetical protein [unclassified Streptococcus]|uniref:hypothetical protein n=1 Tax=unclassified Streptococcus TaxID=2608887 RepID=UPI0018A9EDEA|nr:MULTISPECIES: hypothetical protein [unclassified Streptococcus]MBF8970990.1 hypothetical protein [Streptococcus sp. NLN76]MBG9367906.1 hypothetical protein [Streptococcus sp. NLN64]
MEITREDIRRVFGRYGMECRFDSPHPGVHYKDGCFLTFDQLPLPSEMFSDPALIEEHERRTRLALEMEE